MGVIRVIILCAGIVGVLFALPVVVHALFSIAGAAAK